MNPATSLYIDIVRFVAALVVFLGHASYGKWTGGFLWQFSALGGSAVDIFFVVSGFVIAYVVDTKEKCAYVFTISRMARIYSVAIPSLLITFIFNYIGQLINTAPYISISDHQSNQITAFLANVTFMNEIWNNHIVFGSNEPYWSLGFEVIYYIIFGLAVFTPRKYSYVLVMLAVLVAGPKIIMLFPLWIPGTICYKLTKRKVIGVMLGALILILSFIIMAYYMIYFANYSVRGFDPLDQWTEIPMRYINNYVIGSLFCINILAFDAVATVVYPILSYFSGVIRWISGATFSLYLFHQPTIELLVAMSPWPTSSVACRSFVILGTLATIFALASITERRKDSWRYFISLILEMIKKIFIRISQSLHRRSKFS